MLGKEASAERAGDDVIALPRSSLLSLHPPSILFSLLSVVLSVAVGFYWGNSFWLKNITVFGWQNSSCYFGTPKPSKQRGKITAELATLDFLRMWNDFQILCCWVSWTWYESENVDIKTRTKSNKARVSSESIITALTHSFSILKLNWTPLENQN